VHQYVVLEDGSVREGLAALLAGVRTRIGVHPLVANPFTPIVEVALAVHALVGTLARVTTNVGPQLAHLSKGFGTDSAMQLNIFVVKD